MATLITNAGRAIITNRIIGSGTEPKYGGWGTGSTAANVADTALGAEAAEARVSGTSSRVTTSVTNDTYQVVWTQTSLSGQTIAEVALFDAATVGNMLLRSVFTGVVLAIGDSIQTTAKAQIA